MRVLSLLTPIPLLLIGSACVAETPPAVFPAAAPVQFAAVPPAASQQGCREFDTPVTIGGQQQQAYGTACLQPDGSWKIEQHIADQPPQTYVIAPQVYQSYYPPSYLADPWFYGPPLFLGGLFIGAGWGFHHDHAGFHGAWHDGFRGPGHEGFAGPVHEGFHGSMHEDFRGRR
jgi:hypothetical protein